MESFPALHKKTLFIPGASRGIGLAIALRAARDGENIAVVAKTSEARSPAGWNDLQRCRSHQESRRRLSKDHEYSVQTSETLIEIAATRLILNQLAPA
jgi:NAD(P)-dependent dehydrogenase (short-subunit alcohol dehydrogenase family)